MCLIIVKKKGDDITNELYRSIARSYHLRNRDGMGFAIKKGTSVYLSKGYFNLSNFIHAIKSHSPTKNDELMIHLRKVSAGDRDSINCHPYVCDTSPAKMFIEEGFVDKPVLSHNGTMYKFKKANGVLSDTLNFIKEFAGNPDIPLAIPYLYKIRPQIIKELIGENSKLAIMYPNNNSIAMIGRGWIYNKDARIYVSNTSYKGENCNTHGSNKKYGCGYQYNNYYAMDDLDDDERYIETIKKMSQLTFTD